MTARRNSWGKTFWAFLLFALVGVGATPGLHTKAFGDLEPAPDIKLRSLDGNKFKLSEHLGKIVIINFWAVWCPPCKIEIPELVELYDTYKEEGLIVIGIAIDSGKDDKIQKKAEELGINYPVVNGDDYAIRKSFPPVRAVPTTFLVNQEGKIYKNYLGYQKKEILEEDIKVLLKQ